MTTLNPNEEENSLATEKDKLELAKLRLEIRELERPFWKRPSYVLSALPTLLAIATLVYGVTSGYFSASFTKLENQKYSLEQQIKEFDATRSTIEKQIAELQSQKQELEQRAAGMQSKMEGVKKATQEFVHALEAENSDEAGEKMNLLIDAVNALDAPWSFGNSNDR